MAHLEIGCGGRQLHQVVDAYGSPTPTTIIQQVRKEHTRENHNRRGNNSNLEPPCRWTGTNDPSASVSRRLRRSAVAAMLDDRLVSTLPASDGLTGDVVRYRRSGTTLGTLVLDCHGLPAPTRVAVFHNSVAK
jgi:hypothetical protein